MSGSLVDRMLRQPGARFTWRMTSRQRDVIAYGQGVVDFQAEKVATVDHFVMADEPDSANDGLNAREPPTARAITDGDTVFVLAPDGSGGDWVAFETGVGGLSGSILAPLLWLRGSALDQGDPIPAGEHSVVIDLRAYLDLLAAEERAGEHTFLEFGRVGFSAERLAATVRLDAFGLITHLTLTIPPGVSPIVPVGFESVEQQIDLEWLPVRPAIPTPDAQMRVSGADFIRATLIESGVPGWQDETE